MQDVILNPILSDKIPAKNERKKVQPIAREPTRADNIYIVELMLCYKYYDLTITTFESCIFVTLHLQILFKFDK